MSDLETAQVHLDAANRSVLGLLEATNALIRGRDAALDEVERLRNELADWLARTGYGIDFSHDPHPPVTLTQLAEAYDRLGPGEATVEEWEWTIVQSTGTWKP